MNCNHRRGIRIVYYYSFHQRLLYFVLFIVVCFDRSVIRGLIAYRQVYVRFTYEDCKRTSCDLLKWRSSVKFRVVDLY